MRLYLSSERLGERSGALLDMMGGTRIAIIANGYDGASATARDIYRTEIYDPLAEFAALAQIPICAGRQVMKSSGACVRKTVSSATFAQLHFFVSI